MKNKNLLSFYVFAIFIVAGIIATVAFVEVNKVECSRKSSIQQEGFQQKRIEDHGANDKQTATQDSIAFALNYLKPIYQTYTNNNYYAIADDDPDWWHKFRCDLKIGDILLILFTYCLVGVGGLQAYWLWRTVKVGEISARVAEQALTDLERPAVFIDVINKGFSCHTDGTFRVPTECRIEFQFINYGRTAAQLIDRIETLPVEAGIRTMPYPIPSESKGEPYPVGIIMGVKTPYVDSIRWRDKTDISKFSSQPITHYTPAFIEFFRYQDIFSGRKYINGFCFIYDAESMKLVRHGDECYNYSREEK